MNLEILPMFMIGIVSSLIYYQTDKKKQLFQKCCEKFHVSGRRLAVCSLLILLVATVLLKLLSLAVDWPDSVWYALTGVPFGWALFTASHKKANQK